MGNHSEIHRLDRAALAALYETRMPMDFPRKEIKPLSLLLRRYDAGKSMVLGMSGADGPDVYAVFQLPPSGGIWLLDYFAVRKELRHRGLGSRFFRELWAELPCAEALILEIERIDRSIDAVQKQYRYKRKRFYLKNGVQETGVFSRDSGGTEYEILCLPFSCTPDAGMVRQTILDFYGDFFGGVNYGVFLGPHEQRT